jgi:short-subunit dehydrogenase
MDQAASEGMDRAACEGRPLALVTGASSGIGAAFAERLARDGHDVLIVARRAGRLEALAQRLRTDFGVAVEPVAADLTDPEGLASVERTLLDRTPDLLVNNAGFSGYGPFKDIDPQVVEDLLRIHTLAVARLTRAVVPGMVARGSGAVINVASLLSLSGPLTLGRMTGRATYAGAKAFMLAFTQALAGELEGSGVRAMVVLPGMVHSEFHGERGLPPSLPVMSAVDAVDAALAGLALGEVVCVPGLEDMGLFDRLRDLQQAVLTGGNQVQIAERYRRRP